MKLDRITQLVDISDSSIEKYKTDRYELRLHDDDIATLIINPGKLLNKDRMNFGATPTQAQKIISEIHEELGVTLVHNKTIEYCIDIETDFKVHNHKNIINTFKAVLNLMNYTSAKLDIDNSSDTVIQNCNWKGFKGYKSGRTLKLYSKTCEKMIDMGDKDIVRIELCLNKKPLYQNKINDITNITKAKEEFLVLAKLWKSLMPKRKNKHTIPTFTIIEKLEQRIVD